MTSIALIVDIVDSRRLDDRPLAQRAIRTAFMRADGIAPPERALWPTVGDEFQALYPELSSALAATALVQLILPDDIECRFGLGEGDATEIESRADGSSIQDGSAWWRAREAIETGHRLEHHGHPSLRTWFVGGDPASTAAVDALLLQRDHALSRMKARERRIASAFLEKRTQIEIAADEGISQSAVSQNLQRSGASALVAGLELFDRVAGA
jgi:hypothetical protein